MRARKDRGITLIELLVVMAIIAMFVTLVGARVFKQVDKAKQIKARADIEQLAGALDMFRLEVGRYPTNQEGLAALMQRPASVENWDGPYLKKELPPDPWGHPYVYRFPGQHGDYDLVALGSDGQEGGEGDAVDIVSWK